MIIHLLLDGQVAAEINLNEGDRLIGSTKPSNILIEDPTVSPTHAKLFQKDGKAFIVDLGSERGTIVSGGSAIGPIELKGGESVQLGNFAFQIRVLEDTPQPGGLAPEDGLGAHGGRRNPPPLPQGNPMPPPLPSCYLPVGAGAGVEPPPARKHPAKLVIIAVALTVIMVFVNMDPVFGQRGFRDIRTWLHKIFTSPSRIALDYKNNTFSYGIVLPRGWRIHTKSTESNLTVIDESNNHIDIESIVAAPEMAALNYADYADLLFEIIRSQRGGLTVLTDSGDGMLGNAPCRYYVIRYQRYQSVVYEMTVIARYRDFAYIISAKTSELSYERHSKDFASFCKFNFVPL